MENMKERISVILDAIIKVAQGDYSVEIEPSGRNDELDALAVGVNMMVYDLKDKYETELENERISKLNEQLKIATEKAKESDRLKSSFLANMSHEIRTPMNSILGFAGLLKNPGLSGENRNKYIGLIEQGGDRLLNLINELIDISRIESGQMDVYFTETDIAALVKSVYTFFKPEAETKSLSFIWNKNGLNETNSKIVTDSEKVNTILINLTKNAIKFTDKGLIEIGCSRADDKFEFYVKDSGIGIPKKKQELVFDRFSQVKDPVTSGYEGSGLGLSISKAYVEMLGGNIWLESVEGKGTTFYFTISNNHQNITNT
jgi:signal transduction histidine kinase